MRRSELFSLRWRDVDNKRRTVSLRGAGAKSLQTRHIPLNETARAALKKWRGDPMPHPKLPTFQRRKFRKSWATLLRRAEIKNLRVHDLRHSIASRLVMSGVALNTVRELLGHADLKMILRYAHLAPQHLAEAVSLLDAGARS